MNEKIFQRELLDGFRRLGAWAAKWPDQAVSHMKVGGDGKLRFALPKPCDLIGATPEGGRFMGIECKLARTPIFHVDARLVRQLETLRDLQARGAFAALALNFRFVRKRPPLRVNRALLLMGLSGEAWQEGRAFVLALPPLIGLDPKPPAPMPLYVELSRISGGWEIPAFVLKGPA